MYTQESAVSSAEREALDGVYSDLRIYGSLDPEADFLAVMEASRGPRRLSVVETQRVLMEPVFRYQEGEGLAVTVFRPLRDMAAAEIHNWLLRFRCLDPSFDDLEIILGQKQHRYWRMYDSDLRGKRLYLPVVVDADILEPCSFEYVTIPDDIFSSVNRTGYTSENVRRGELLVTWRFPDDPERPWHVLP